MAEPLSAKEQLERTELELKQAEVKLKERELAVPTGILSKLKVSAAEATVIVGALAFLGSFLGTSLQERNKLALKQKEQEAALILDALKGDDSARNLARLRLLIDTGFITDKDGVIRNLILSGKYGDAIAAPSSPALIGALAQNSAPLLLREILKIAGVSTGLDLQDQVDFAGIAAVGRVGGRLMLYYDKAQVSAFDKANRNSWTVPAILAHEIGHVVLGHIDQSSPLCFSAASSPSTCKSRRAIELEADQFAGRVLRQLGASLEQARDSFAFLPPATDGVEPTRNERIEALLKGWRG